MRSTTILTASALVLTALAIPALGKPPKPIEETVPFRDATADPTGVAVGDGHCAGLLPQEAPYQFKAPARGTLKVSISGFQGDWALHVMDEKRSVLAAQDAAPPETEKISVKVRKAGVINVLPCNLAGTPDSVIKLTFTYA